MIVKFTVCRQLLDLEVRPHWPPQLLSPPTEFLAPRSYKVNHQLPVKLLAAMTTTMFEKPCAMCNDKQGLGAPPKPKQQVRNL